MNNDPNRAPPTSFFQVEGLVVRDPVQGQGYCYVTLREGDNQYWDVCFYEDGPIDQARQLRGGAVAKVRGHLGKRKVKGVVDAQGRQFWETSLIGKQLRARAPAVPQQAAPQQSYHQQPQQGYVNLPPMGGQAYANPAWPNPNQPNVPPMVRQDQTGANHPASFDGNDDLPIF